MTSVRMSGRSNFNSAREASAASRAAVRLAEQRAQSEKVAAEKARAEEAARAKQVMARANSTAINEAVRVAEAAATAGPLLPGALLEEMREGRLSKQAELLAEVKSLAKEEVGTLRYKLGEAILQSGKSIASLIREWDKNGDGVLSKIEFKQAVRLNLVIKASNEEIDSIYDSFDTGGNGNVKVLELRPAVKEIFDHVRQVKEAEERLKSEASTMSQLAVALDGCLAAAKEWEALRNEQWKLRNDTSLETRLSHALDKSTNGFMFALVRDLSQKWGADEKGLIGKDPVCKQIELLKNKGEVRIDGSAEEVAEKIAAMFGRLLGRQGATDPPLSAPGSTSPQVQSDASATSVALRPMPPRERRRSRDDGLLDLPAALQDLGKAKREQKAREQDLSMSVMKWETKAKELQVAYATNAARADKQIELTRALADAKGELKRGTKSPVAHFLTPAPETVKLTSNLDSPTSGGKGTDGLDSFFDFGLAPAAQDEMSPQKGRPES